MSQLVYFKESGSNAAFCVPPFSNFVAPPDLATPTLETLPVFPYLGGTNQQPYAFAFGLQGTKFFWKNTPYSEFAQSGPPVIQWYDRIGPGQGTYVSVAPFLLAGGESGFLPPPPSAWSVRTDTMGAAETKEWVAPSTVGAPVFGGGSTSFTIYVSVTVKAFDHFEFIGPNVGTEIVGPKVTVTKNDAARILAVYVEKTSTTQIRVIPKGKIPKSEWPQYRVSIAQKVTESLRSQGIRIAEKAALAGVDSLKAKFVAK